MYYMSPCCVCVCTVYRAIKCCCVCVCGVCVVERMCVGRMSAILLQHKARQC